MPQLGESVAEGIIGKWLKNEGDPIEKDEPIVEVITDKVNAEIPSPVSGVLERISQPEGATVAVGQEIAVITDGSEGSEEAQEMTSGGTGSEEPADDSSRQPVTAGSTAANDPPPSSVSAAQGNG